MSGELSAGSYRDIFLEAPDGILVVDAEGKIREANRETFRLFGYTPEELLGREVELLVPQALRGLHAAHRESFREHPKPRPMGIGLELRALRKSGEEVPVEISLSPLDTAAGLRVICIVRDLTEQRKFREFGRAALRAAEEERKRLALELHDDMAQRLAALLLRVRLAGETARRERREALLAELREEIVDAAAALHRIARGLRPPALTEAGLEAAIRSDLRNRLAETDLDIQLDLDPVDDLLDEDQKLAIYRIVQEAVSNVVRHAQASRLAIRVGAGNEIVTDVEDDGRGFVVEEVEALVGRLGLLGMRERAAAVGARLSIHSELGSGTRIRVVLPLGPGILLEEEVTESVEEAVDG